MPALAECYARYIIYSKRETLNLYWFNAGPPSTTLGLNSTSRPSVGSQSAIDESHRDNHDDKRNIYYDCHFVQMVSLLVRCT